MSWATDLTSGFQAGSMMADSVMRGIQQQKDNDRRAQMDAIQMALLQKNNPGLHVAEQTTVDGQPALKAEAVQPGTEKDNVQAFGGGVTYNDDEKRRVDKEILRGKIDAQLQEGRALMPLEREKAEMAAEIANRRGFNLNPGEQHFEYDPITKTMQPSASSPGKAAEPKTYTLSPGQKVFDANGKEIASLDPLEKESKNTVVAPGSSIVGPDGRVIFTNPLNPKEPARPSESMQNAQMFGARADQAEKELQQVLKTFNPSTVNPLTHPFDASGNMVNSFKIPFTDSSLQPNSFKSDERQSFEQAQRNFINAVLRKESGASISEPEFRNAREQYFPQPGDGTEVLAQKARNRAQAIAGLKAVGSGDPVPDAPNPPSASTPDSSLKPKQESSASNDELLKRLKEKHGL